MTPTLVNQDVRFIEEIINRVQTEKNIIEQKNKDITDSIKYAQLIQQALMPSNEMIMKCLPDSFIFHKPKDIVSGDFYWIDKKDHSTTVAVADCTGHGVPGAFMSILGNNMLNRAVKEKCMLQPSLILDELNKSINEALTQNHESITLKDGMDISLCRIDSEKNELQFSGAFNGVWIIRENQIIEIKADKFSIGEPVDTYLKKFTNHIIQLQQNDCIYIFSDGYSDQFGGRNGKKFMKRRFKELLLSIHHQPMNEQKYLLDKTLEEWKGNEEQVDDILVMGIRV